MVYLKVLFEVGRRRNRPGGRGRAKGYGIICGSASEGAGLVVVRTAISAWASALCNIPFFS